MGLLDCHGNYNNIILPYIKITLAYLLPSVGVKPKQIYLCMFAFYVHMILFYALYGWN
jgi:hypothetical protein